MKEEKTYCGSLMEKGKKAEDIIFAWLKTSPYAGQIIDTREFRFSQRLDVDCGIEDMHGRVVLGEIKSDAWLGKSGNILFELFRINHFVPPFHYLGWGWRSPAERLFYYSPYKQAVYVFKFCEMRKRIGEIVSKTDPCILQGWFRVIPTDRQKTTINLLIPEKELAGTFRVFSL